MNTQRPMRTERDEHGGLQVHSCFLTVQGEGPYAGHRATFLRLAGCNLQCPMCDTEYTQDTQWYDLSELVTLLAKVGQGTDLVVVTGGEPFRQNVTPLALNLVQRGYRVQFETNGVLSPGPEFPWSSVTVVVSPKTGKLHPDVAHNAHAYKYVVEAGNMHRDGLPVQALQHPLGGYKHVARPPDTWNGPIYVQPMDAKDPEENDANVQACVASVMKHGKYILGVQMHKLTGLP